MPPLPTWRQWLRPWLAPQPVPQVPTPAQLFAEQLATLQATLAQGPPPATPELAALARGAQASLRDWLQAGTPALPEAVPPSTQALLSQLAADWASQRLTSCDINLSPELDDHRLSPAWAAAIRRACEDLLQHVSTDAPHLPMRLQAQVDEAGCLNIRIGPQAGTLAPVAAHPASWRLLVAQAQLMALGGRLTLQDTPGGHSEGTVTLPVPWHLGALTTAGNPPAR